MNLFSKVGTLWLLFLVGVLYCLNLCCSFHMPTRSVNNFLLQGWGIPFFMGRGIIYRIEKREHRRSSIRCWSMVEK